MTPQDHQYVVITGGNKGIGLSIAKVFSRLSEFRIILIGRNEADLQKAEKVCLEEGAHYVETLAMDLVDPDPKVLSYLKTLEITLLINNAGSYLYGSLAETNKEQFIRQFELNTLSAYNITQPLLPQLKKRDHALIVNICSIASLQGFGDSGAYAMSKHALIGYTRSLREELKDDGIGVTAINLGQTWSTSWKDIEVDQNDLIDPEDVGKIILGLSSLSPRTVAEEINLMPQKGQIPPV
ncbi:SDR family NAD(P)-dependent oxidoreductase [Balneola sp. MJW-20]|uniref:SDR family NAD(P)-dependent oxidoreductase n=1 Tax=Gracilimonas aurantiaca TaxID=3234185 RepID=UPI003467D268